MSTFNPTRVWQVLRLQVLLHSQSILMYFGPMLAIMFIATVNANNDSAAPHEQTLFVGLYSFFLIAAGFIWAANSLPENKTPDGRQAFLTLPATDTEKWVGIYLYSGPLFYVVFTIGYWTLTLLVQAVAGAFDIVQLTPFNPFDPTVGDALQVYFFVAQPLGFLAASYFDKSPAPKAAGAVILIFLSVALIMAIAFRIVFYDYFTGFFTPAGDDLDFGGSGPLDVDLVSSFWLSLALGLYVLAVTYFRFHEKEV